MLVEKSYLEMYTDSKLGDYNFFLNYSGRFKGYNANVKRRRKEIIFNLSKNWKEINDDVKIGLIQELFNRIFKTKIRTQNIELYEIFLKKIHIAVPKIKTDPILDESFDRVNERYFNGLMEKTNLVWGRDSLRKLGSYEYGSDTISISNIFQDSDNKCMLDYIMYHEMLHKKHKFYTKNGKSFHHTREFKRQERKFKDYDEIEKRINALIRSKKRKKAFFDFF
jgi:predicted metal-dependent hydrolase